MTPERWQKILDLLDQALSLAPEQRSGMLDRACASDPDLRREVETLLASSNRVPSSFLQASPLPISLTPGTKLGEYEIVALVGSGGMGEVYRARDVRLGRDVAIKVLLLLSADAERLRRFEQEARAAAALNHPNILAVHQMGTYEDAPYLVSELLEGETLRECIKRGRLEVRKAIDYGMQIASGLAAAHEKGIVHRDLKPENLFVTKDKRVKILDFGLAKLTQPQSDLEPSAPTATEGTEPGVVMGTVGYMSPEQVRGQSTDHRTDIFSFGAILYEMLTGKRAFQKPTAADIQSAVLSEDPPGISQVTGDVPAALQRVVHHCLEKSPEQRFQSASDLGLALETLPRHGSGPGSAPLFDEARFWRMVVPAVIALTALATIGYLYSRRARNKVSEKDTIVLADFDNRTGDAVFDDALKQALAADLEQSPLLNILSEKKTGETLRLMGRSPTDHLTENLAREICQRTSSKALLVGSITNLGGDYGINLKAEDCGSGDSLGTAQQDASSKGKVLQALDDAATTMRSKLGESLASIQKFDTPLQQVTTSSLEALKAYTEGKRVFDENDNAGSVPLFKRAVELDPSFAIASAYLGVAYNNVGETALAFETLRRAYDLRERASERERFFIVSFYHTIATGELDKANRELRLWIEEYPSDANYPHLLLGYNYEQLGQYQQSAAEFRQHLLVDPDSAIAYLDLSTAYLFMDDLNGAKTIVDEAFARKMDNGNLRLNLYLIGFAQKDAVEMEQQVTWAADTPGFEDALGCYPSDTEAYYGRIGYARNLSRRVMELKTRAGGKEEAASCQLNAALREAEVGEVSFAKQEVAAALATFSGIEEKKQAALILARSGDIPRARALTEELEKNYGANTLWEYYWLPTIRAEIELRAGAPSQALSDLETAAPYELSWINYLYPAYVRGQAYLLARNGPAAVAEFQKLLDHRGVVGNFVTGALAHLQIGRAYAMAGETARAKLAYQDFLTLWKDADPDIPILKAAKAEYSNLQ